MVRRARIGLTLGLLLAWDVQRLLADIATESDPLIDRLDETTRSKVILALAGLVMLGILMMGLTWLAFRMLRGQFRRTEEAFQREERSRKTDEWTRKPLDS